MREERSVGTGRRQRGGCWCWFRCCRWWCYGRSSATLSFQKGPCRLQKGPLITARLVRLVYSCRFRMTVFEVRHKGNENILQWIIVVVVVGCVCVCECICVCLPCPLTLVAGPRDVPRHAATASRRKMGWMTLCGGVGYCCCCCWIGTRFDACRCGCVRIVPVDCYRYCYYCGCGWIAVGRRLRLRCVPESGTWGNPTFWSPYLLPATTHEYWITNNSRQRPNGENRGREGLVNY